jgi:alpha-ribazole phosphatase
LTTIMLIRHAEAEGAGCYLGRRSDPSLSARGRAQAEALARWLVGERLAAIYSSPLRRALETARAVAAPHHLPVETVADLAEIDFGLWDGLSYQEIEARQPEQLACWLADPLTVAPPEGESLAELSQRVINAFEPIVTRHPGETMIIVTHGGPVRVILCQGLGLPLAAHWHLHQDLATVSRLELGEDGVFRYFPHQPAMDPVEPPSL